jgi:AcrR family transcriptional regulator
MGGRQHSVPSGGLGTRDRILRAAAVLFERDGVRAVSVAAIIEAAGVARATFYRHFPAKEDLVVAWLDSSTSNWVEVLAARAAERAADPSDELLAFFEVLAEHVAEEGFRGCPYLNAAAELRRPSAEVRRAQQSFFAALEMYLGSLAGAAGFVEPARTAAQLRVLVCGVLSLALTLRDGMPGRDALGLVRALVDRG